LPFELESFVSGAGDRGVVIFSLGTLGDAVLQKHHVAILAGALGRLEQRVVWRLRSKKMYYLAILCVYTPICKNVAG